jgi:hypothetical protein
VTIRLQLKSITLLKRYARSVNIYYVTDKDPTTYLPIGVQKSYFLLPKAEREILNSALEQYHPGQQDPILIGGSGLLKTALRLMSAH